MNLHALIKEIGAPQAAQQLGLSVNYVYKLLAGHRTVTRDVVARCLRAWPARLDVLGTLQELHPDWPLKRLAAEANAIVAISQIPEDVVASAADGEAA